MADYAKFNAAIISKAEYDADGTAFSTVQEDFLFICGPLAVYDQVDILMKPWGRADGLPLFINELGVDRWTGTIAQHGVESATGYATPTRNTIPAACIVIVQVTNAATLLAIDNTAKHFVLGVEGPDLNGVDLPSGLLPYEFDTPMPSARWTELRNALVSLGLEAVSIDGWRDGNQEATPRDFSEAFKKFIKIK